MSIYGLSTEFTESIRFVTTVHSIDLFSDRNGSKWAQTNTERAFGIPICSSGFTELTDEFRMTESDARWGGRAAGWGFVRWVGWGRPRHVRAWQGRVG